MKREFNWLRGEIEANSVECGGAKIIDMHTVRTLINKTESKLDKIYGDWNLDYCEWKVEDAEANLYVTKCEQRQLIFEGTATENDYKFCPYCGRPIVEVE